MSSSDSHRKRQRLQKYHDTSTSLAQSISSVASQLHPHLPGPSSARNKQIYAPSDTDAKMTSDTDWAGSSKQQIPFSSASDDEKLARQLQDHFDWERVQSEPPRLPPPPVSVPAPAPVSGMPGKSKYEDNLAAFNRMEFDFDQNVSSFYQAYPVDTSGKASQYQASIHQAQSWMQDYNMPFYPYSTTHGPSPHGPPPYGPPPHGQPSNIRGGKPSQPKHPSSKGKRKVQERIPQSTRPQSVAVVAEALDMSNDAEVVRSYVTRLKLRCTACHDVEALESLPNLLNAAAAELKGSCTAHNPAGLASTRVCCKCAAHTCIGCGEAAQTSSPTNAIFSSSFSTPVHPTQLRWHCDRGRLALIWLILCAYDTMTRHNKPQILIPSPKTPATATTSKRHPHRKGFLPAGIGYGGTCDRANYASYGESDFDECEGPDEGEYDSYEELSGALPVRKPSRAKSAVKDPPRVTHDPEDAMTSRVMKALAMALPSLEGSAMSSTFDFEPPKTLLSLLCRSSILDRVAELLRDDSIDDAVTRNALYQDLLGLVRALGSHHSTSSTVLAQRTTNRAGHDLFKVSMGKATRMHGEGDNQNQSLVVCLQGLTTQSRLMLQGAAKAVSKDFLTDESQQMLLLCRNVVDLADFLRVNAAYTVDDTILQEQNGIDPDTLCLQGLGLAELPDEVLLDASVYGKQARAMADPPAGRMRHLITEVARLKTGLPPGIFVRYGSSRLDVMKILIIGPQGTPYENGLFEFDLFCDRNFPQAPPKMTFRTTGNGMAAFNPNLYPCGKVCLSLLGTWNGETWRPGKSTLLQVLVSLQAMVFCDEPHCNEPGCEYDRGSLSSKQYNRRVFALTAQYAMLEWLTGKPEMHGKTTKIRKEWYLAVDTPANEQQVNDTPHDVSPQYMPPYSNVAAPGREVIPRETAAQKKGQIWSEIVQKHFATAGQIILATIDEWVKDKPPPPPTTPQKRGKGQAGREVPLHTTEPQVQPSIEGNDGNRSESERGITGGSASGSASRCESGSVSDEGLEEKLRSSLSLLKENGKSRFWQENDFEDAVAEALALVGSAVPSGPGEQQQEQQHVNQG